MKTIYIQHWHESDRWSGKSYSFGMLYTSKSEAETKTKELLSNLRVEESKMYGAQTPESYDFPANLEVKEVPDSLYKFVEENQLQKIWSEKEINDRILKLADLDK